MRVRLSTRPLRPQLHDEYFTHRSPISYTGSAGASGYAEALEGPRGRRYSTIKHQNPCVSYTLPRLDHSSLPRCPLLGFQE